MRRCKSIGLLRSPRSSRKCPATAPPHPPHRGNGPPQSSDRTVSFALRLDSAGLARRSLRQPNPPAAAPPPHQPRAHRTLPGNIVSGAARRAPSRRGVVLVSLFCYFCFWAEGVFHRLAGDPDDAPERRIQVLRHFERSP